MEEKFNRIIRKHEASLKEQNKMFGIMGYCKLLFVFLAGSSLYLAYRRGFDIWDLLLAFAETVILVVLWIYQDRIHKKIEFSKGMITIAKRHLDRLSGNWINFSDMGEEFADPDHPYACDLDIVGRKSLFQLLNTTNTWHGRVQFEADLLHPKYDTSEIVNRQQAIGELIHDVEFANEFEYCTSKIGVDTSAIKLVRKLKDKTAFLKSETIKRALLYVPFLTLAFIIAVISFRLRPLYYIAIGGAILQSAVWSIGMRKTQAYLAVLTNLHYRLDAYSTAIQMIDEKDYTSKTLKEIQSRLGGTEFSAEQAIKELGRLSERLTVKSNPILYFIVNILLLWDIRAAIRLEQWKQKYADASEQWFLALGEFESLMCFANLPRVCNHVTAPRVTEKRKTIWAKEMGHPLIGNEERVTNDVNLEDHVLIISGSNMSGKTTFLRTVGINLVLAECGSFVCAKQMDFSPMDIMTSMRIADDLKEGISMFYAELKRIKGIIELVRRQPNTLFLIDEIFRGTNSVDRLSGAKAVLSKLNELGAVGMITTHDLELCKLAEESPRIQNYSFSESYRNKKILFDYKIRPGKSTTTNARYLMELVGIEFKE